MNDSDLFSKFVRKVVAPLWAAKEGSPYLRHLDTLGAAKLRHIGAVRDNQRERLSKLMAHAYENTRFYRRRMDDAGLDPGKTWRLEDLGKLPLLTKDDIRAAGEDMVARNFMPDELVPKKTSGSTGVSLDFFVDVESLQWKRAVAISYDRWTGWDIGEKIGAVWGNPRHNQNWRTRLRNALLERYIFLDTLEMDETSMLDFYHRLKTYRPVLLFGHAHSLFLFARFLEKKGADDIRPRGIISTCMVLHDFERKSIERTFACRVTNRYGCEEVSLIACECPVHKGLHLNLDTLVVEFIRDGRPVAPGEPGAVVVTDLTNYGMPFIRYKVGDVGILSERACTCGCAYPLMESVEGRVADYVITPDGKYISGISLTENFAVRLPDVKQMQIVQERQDFLLFRIVKGDTFTPQTVVDIGKLARERFGERMAWRIEYVDTIRSESSGKYRFCISMLPNPFS